MTEELNKGEIVIYTAADGSVSLDARLENDTIWLTQKAMAELFGCSTDNISLHLKNIYKENELNKSSTTEDFSVVQKEGPRTVSRKHTFYNLDAIISVGYRVNSSRATQFRIWATSVLKDFMTKGYVLNEKRLKEQQTQISTLKNSIALMERSLVEQIDSLDVAKDVSKILHNFALGLNLLDDYDHKQLDTKGLNKTEAKHISKEEFLKVINDMKSDFESDVFAVPKDDSFESSVNQIYQTFDGVELYPTLEEKAAMLLYLIVKNHSFADGNKRIGASCFLYFLNQNNILYKNDKPILDNATLFALTLLIATSKPKEMETVKQIVLSVLNRA
ncbi:MAG: virulence protein RhuM/Fic/DOC family protein [Bacteroidales bacterium]|nr:virulence protein RhuM/Fic/DOC family protein [Bacteroidales bacterium]